MAALSLQSFVSVTEMPFSRVFPELKQDLLVANWSKVLDNELGKGEIGK